MLQLKITPQEYLTQSHKWFEQRSVLNTIYPASSAKQEIQWLPKGTVLSISCWFSNSPKNPAQIDEQRGEAGEDDEVRTNSREWTTVCAHRNIRPARIDHQPIVIRPPSAPSSPTPSLPPYFSSTEYSVRCNRCSGPGTFYSGNSIFNYSSWPTRSPYNRPGRWWNE